MKKTFLFLALIVGCSGEAPPVFGNQGGGSASSDSSSAAGGAGGAGGSAACETREDCTGALAPECAAWLCVAGLCIIDHAPAGTVLEGNVPGDCKRLICDGGGNAMYEQIEDPEDDGNECTTDTCSGFATIHEPHVEGYPCARGVCTDMGICVECLYDFQCASGEVCSDGSCS